MIRFVDKEELNALNRKADKTARLTKGDVSVIGNRLLGEIAVFGWRKINDHNHPGLLDAKGTPIPFNAENRNMLMKRCREFSNFVNETSIDASVFLEIQAGDKAHQENQDEIKNDY
jgi:hypothetical protein